MTTKKVIFINSHPIQYFVPLYKYLNQQGLPTECWYCSDENVRGHIDRQFGRHVAWDLPLLEGYKARFFRNHSWNPTLYGGFFGLINLGMVRALFAEPKSVIVVHGWAYVTHVLVILFGRLRGHTICLRGESPLNQEVIKSKHVIFMKRLILSGILFRFVNFFLYIGKQNRRFYEFYGVSDSRLVFTPYSVDNDRFGTAANELIPQRAGLRSSMGIGAGDKVILFAGKLIAKKRPMDLVMAYHKLPVSDKCLVIVGDGDLRDEVENYVSTHMVPNVHLAGFINQTEIVRYYAIADVFVMCSGAGETWGLSVNEAMNFGLPVVVSDMCGCAEDLVRRESGYGFSTGDVNELTSGIMKAFQTKFDPATIVRLYDYDAIMNGLMEVTNCMRHSHPAS